MPKDKNIQRVLVVGSGPIVIGQAAEFDYAGTQACRALREDGIEIILVNSNPATIMTDPSMADKIYIEPLTLTTIKRIIEKEKPDSILSGLGGQTALNLCMQLARDGFLEKHHVRLLGSSPECIRRSEDRQLFKETMLSIGEPCIPSETAVTCEEAVSFAQKIGYPVIVRPAFTLAGSGGGIAENDEELREIAKNGLALSPIRQVLIEKSVAGWKEIEYEVIRDGAGNAVTVCSMENLLLKFLLKTDMSPPIVVDNPASKVSANASIILGSIPIPFIASRFRIRFVPQSQIIIHKEELNNKGESPYSRKITKAFGWKSYYRSYHFACTV
jgi:carbamoyl-phosphate synthase large subunit